MILLYHVTLKRYSSGRSESEARGRAEKIQYNVVFKDSVLDLGSGFAIDKASKFRGQNVEMEIRIPVGKKIIFDESIENKLNEVSFKRKRARWPRNGWDFDYDDIRRWRTGVEFTMGSDGILTSYEGSKQESTRPGRAVQAGDGIVTVRIIINRRNRLRMKSKEKLKKRRRKQKESQERIEKLEKKKNEGQESNTSNLESMDDNEEHTSFSSPSPVFSLIRNF